MKCPECDGEMQFKLSEYGGEGGPTRDEEGYLWIVVEDAFRCPWCKHD
jgi:ssDNA-binding Zn-finger/Zn-ribbon topoisomerase 1